MAPETAQPSRPVSVEMEPRLLAEVLRHVLTEHGVEVVDPAEPAGRAAVALVGGPGPAKVEADVVVRLEQTGMRLPAVVQIEDVTGGRSRAAAVVDVGELVDLIVSLASD